MSEIIKEEVEVKEQVNETLDENAKSARVVATLQGLDEVQPQKETTGEVQPEEKVDEIKEEKETVVPKTLEDWYNEKMKDIGTVIRPSATLAKVFALFNIPFIEEDGKYVSANDVLKDVQFSTITRAGDLDIIIFLANVDKLPILISQVGNLATMTHKVEITRLNTQLPLKEKYIKLFSELKNITNDPIELISYDFGGKNVIVEKESYIFNMIRELVLEEVFIKKGFTPYVNVHKNDLKTNPISISVPLKQLFEGIVNVEKPFEIKVPDFVNHTDNPLKINVSIELKEISNYFALTDDGSRYMEYETYVLLETEDNNRITRYPLNMNIKAEINDFTNTKE